MKKIIIALIAFCSFYACKKDKSSAIDCKRLQQFSSFSARDGQRDFTLEYNEDGTVKAKINKVYSNSFTAKYLYTYENGGRRITVRQEDDNIYFNIYELNGSGQVGYAELLLTDGVRKDTYTYDANGFMATKTFEYYKTGQTSPYLKLFTSQVNTVENGNLVKSIYTDKNVTTNITDAPVTRNWEYALDKPAYTNIPTPFGARNNDIGWFIGKPEDVISKNRVTGYSNSQGLKVELDYLVDDNGNLTQINYTDISGTAGPANNGKFTYMYKCN
jgi:hypothetical protein